MGRPRKYEADFTSADEFEGVEEKQETKVSPHTMVVGQALAHFSFVCGGNLLTFKQGQSLMVEQQICDIMVQARAPVKWEDEA
jgi:hypothetical protein